MEKMMQTDLFEIMREPGQSGSVTGSSFFDRFRVGMRLDQAILTIIVLLIVGIILFTMGFEKGKRQGLEILRKERDAHKTSIQELTRQIENSDLNRGTTNSALPGREGLTAPTLPSRGSSAETGQVLAVSNEPDSGRLEGKYTIQLITYTSSKQAQEQIDRLKAKGFHGFIIPSGTYLQVCVNGFQSRDDAKMTLNRLQENGLAPKDAYIRLLPS